MAIRPFAFGARFVDKGRTVRVRTVERDRRSYVVEVERKGKRTQRRDHASLPSAVRDFAQAWRDRLN